MQNKYSYSHLFCLHAILFLTQTLLVRGHAENQTSLTGSNATFECEITNSDEKKIRWAWKPKICPSWALWEEWTECSRTCGGGKRTRLRECVTDSTMPVDVCFEVAVEVESCNNQVCSSWSSWSAFGDCSRSCDTGTQFRRRRFLNANGGACEEDDIEVKLCNTNDCQRCAPNWEEVGLSNGFVVCDESTEIGSVCTFSCRQNYVIVGVSNLVCQEEKIGVAEWSHEPPTCSERCTDEIDAVFVIDSSVSIGNNSFRGLREFIAALVQRFRVGPDAAQFGAIRYNSVVEDLWDLDDFPVKEDLLTAIANIPYNGRGTLIGKAINYTNDFKFLPSTGRRPNVPKVVIVLTDGESFDDVSLPSRLLKADNTWVIAVGIGNVNEREINEIASDPDDQFSFLVANVTALNRITELLSNQIRLCQREVNTTCNESSTMDVVFIVDGSSSIGRSNFVLMQDLVKRLVRIFNVSENGTHVGYVRYNNKVDEQFQLNDFNNTEDVIRAIEAVPYEGRGTRTGDALMFAATQSLRITAGRRPGIPAIAIVMTDGKASDSVVQPAKALKRAAHVLAIGIQNAILAELKQIASREDEDVFKVDDFDELATIIAEIGILACEAGLTF